MQPIIKNIKEAENFFLNNASGVCLCIREDGQEFQADTYPSAVAFFENKESATNE